MVFAEASKTASKWVICGCRWLRGTIVVVCVVELVVVDDVSVTEVPIKLFTKQNGKTSLQPYFKYTYFLLYITSQRILSHILTMLQLVFCPQADSECVSNYMCISFSEFEFDKLVRMEFYDQFVDNMVRFYLTLNRAICYLVYVFVWVCLYVNKYLVNICL